jgi:hypothetical protein
MSNQVARTERNRMKLIKLRDRVRQSTTSFISRQHARLSWWQSAFRVPTLVGRFFSGFNSLWMAFLSLLGVAPKSHSGRGVLPGKVYMRGLLVEGLESRQLMAINITTPIAVDGVVNNAEKNAVVISGTATPFTSGGPAVGQVFVSVQDGINTPVPALATVTGGVWSATLNLSSLSDTGGSGQPGSLNVVVFDNVNFLHFNSTTIQKDTVAPVVNLPFDITSDDVINIAESNGVSVQGTAPIGSVVTLQFTSGSFSATRTVSPNGVGIFSNSGTIAGVDTPVNVSSLANGATLVVTATVTDLAGNIGSDSRSAVTDFSAPPAPTITAPTNGQAFNGTTGSAVVVTGVTAPNGAISISTLPSGATFTGVANGAGVYSIPVNLVPIGTNPAIQINVSAVDSAGNPSTSSVTVALDVTAPSLTSAYTTVSPFFGVNLSNVGTVPFSGASDAIGQTVTLVFTDSQLPTPASVTATAVVNASGNYSGTANLSTLSNGNISVAISVSDSVGNSTSIARILTKDSSAPNLAITGTIGGDGIVNASDSAAIAVNGTGVDTSVGASAVAFTVVGAGGPVTGTATVTGSNFSFSLNLSSGAFTGGSYTVTVTQTDGLGNLGTTSQTFTLDKVAPGTPAITGATVDVSTPLANGGTTNDSTILFNGTAPSTTGEANGTIVLTAVRTAPTAGSPFQIASGSTTGTGASRTWSLLGSALPLDGTYSITARHLDVAGNPSSTASVAWVVNLDTTAPTLLISTPSAATVFNASAAANVSVTGTFVDATSISLNFFSMVNSAVVTAPAVLNSPASGDWSASGVNLSSLPDGGILLLVTATDAAGNATTTSRSFSKDTVTSTPVLSTPITADNIVNIAERNALLTFQGAGAEPGASVTLSITDPLSSSPPLSFGPVIANSLGGFVFSNVDLSVFGSVEIGLTATVTSVDTVSNTATSSSSFALDTLAPTLSAITNNWGAQGINATEQTNVVLSGTTNALGRPVTFTFDDTGANSTTTPQILRTVTANGTTGAFATGSPAISLAALLDGTMEIVVSTSDAAGNAVSTMLAPNKDSELPFITINANIAGNDIVGISEVTSVAVLGLASGTGSLLNNVTITFRDVNNLTLPTSPVLTPVSGGNYGVSTNLSSLADGPIVVSVSGTDLAGNSTTVTRTITKDTLAPVVAITTPAVGSSVNASQASGLLIVGTAVEANGIANAFIQISGPSGSPIVQPLTVTSGSFTTAGNLPNVSSLGDGTLTITVFVTDNAGNTSSDSITVQKDSINPSVVLSSVGTVFADGYINAVETGSVTVNGTVFDGSPSSGLVGRTVSITFTDGVTTTAAQTVVSGAGGAFTSPAFNLSSLTNGPITINATVTDAAGNSGSGSLWTVKDAAAPTPTILTVAGNDVINATEFATISISGTAEPNRPVQITFGGASSPTTGPNVVVANASGNFTWTLDSTERGLVGADSTSLLITVNSSDVAGNSGVITRTVVKDTVLPTATTPALASGLTTPISNAEAANFSLTGSVNDATPNNGVMTGQTVTIVVQDSTSGTPQSFTLTGTVTAAAGPTYVYTTTAQNIQSFLNGTITVASLSVTDKAGNVRTTTTGLPSYQLDKLAPLAPTLFATVGTTSTVITPSGNISNNAKTNDNLPILHGVLNPNDSSGNAWTLTTGAQVEVLLGTTSLGFANVGAGGAWSFPVTTPLADGARTFTVRAIDSAGNVQTAALPSFTLNIDTIAPVLVLGSPITADNVANNVESQALTISGTGADPNGTVSITIGSITQTATANSSGAYSSVFNISSLSDGPLSVSATSTDDAFNVGTATVVNFQKITTIPTPVVNTVGAVALSIDNLINASERLAVNVAGTGAVPNRPVTVVFTDVNNATVQRVTLANGAGAFSLAPANLANLTGLSNGPVDITVTSLDIYGNAGSASLLVTLDATAPNILITTPISGDGFVRQSEASTFSFNVTGFDPANPSVTVTMTDSATPMPNVFTGTFTPGALGVINVNLNSTSLIDGVISLKVENADLAGNIGMDTKTFTLDRVAPAITITNPTTLSGDGRINASEASSGIVVSGTGAHPGSTVTIRVVDGSSSTPNVVFTAVADSLGAYSGTSPSLSGQVDGALSITAESSDPASNLGVSAAATPTLDKTIAAITITGPIAGNNVINAAEAVSLIVSGTNGEPNSSVLVTIADQDSLTPNVTRTVTADSSGNWDLSSNTAGLLGLTDTTNLVITASTADLAGNTSSVTFGTAVTLDKSAPAIAISTVSTDDRINATEAGAFVVSGTGANPGPVTVTIIQGSNTKTVSGTTANSSGAFTAASINLLAATAFTSGNFTITVTSTDAAGNVGSNSRTVLLDMVNPTLPSLVVTSQTGFNAGILSSGSHTSDNTLLFTGSGIEAISSSAAPITSVEILDNTTVVGNATFDQSTGLFSFTSGTLSEELKQFRVRVTDAVGNVSTTALASATNITIDTFAPAMNVQDTIAGDDFINSAEATAVGGVVISGTTVNGASVQVTIVDSNNNTVTKSATANGSGVFSISLLPSEITPLVEGNLQVIGQTTDLAGNTGFDIEIVKLDRLVGVTITSPANGGTVNATQSAALNVMGSVLASDGGNTVTVTVSGGSMSVSSGPVTTSGTGAYSLASSLLNISTLPDGPIIITAVTTDAAGNSTSASVNLTKDTTASLPVINVIATNDVVDATEQTSVQVTGTNAEPNRPVTVTFQSGVMTLNVPGASNALGVYALNIPADLTTLPDGNVLVTVTTSDAAGNTRSATRTIVKDTTGPVVTTSLLTVSLTGTTIISSAALLAEDAISGPSAVTFTLTSIPMHGFIALSSAPLVPITSFTQAQVNSGQVLYASVGSSANPFDAMSFNVSDAAGNTSTGTLSFARSAVNLPNVTQSTINNGNAQRSKLKTLSVDFDQVVNGVTTPGAVVVQKRADTAGGGPAVDVVGVVVTPSTVGVGPTAFTRLTITFTPSTAPLTTFVDSTGSLIDGNYQIVLDASKISSVAGGFQLDGDNNGVSGVNDNYVFGDEAKDNFFRMFGDFDGGSLITGQSFVDNFDAGVFLGSYLNPPNYNSIFDFDEDGFVDNFDAGVFLGNYLKPRNLNGFNP